MEQLNLCNTQLKKKKIFEEKIDALYELVLFAAQDRPKNYFTINVAMRY